jgi:hypothetical protein
LISACAGSIIGIGEVALLPLDVLKIKVQTGTVVSMDLIKSEGVRGLYRGATWTAARNAPGSFALFGGAAFAKDAMDVVDHRKATFLQNFVASIAGAVASIAISAPVCLILVNSIAGCSKDPYSSWTVSWRRDWLGNCQGNGEAGGILVVLQGSRSKDPCSWTKAYIQFHNCAAVDPLVHQERFIID